MSADALARAAKLLHGLCPDCGRVEMQVRDDGRIEIRRIDSDGGRVGAVIRANVEQVWEGEQTVDQELLLCGSQERS